MSKTRTKTAGANLPVPQDIGEAALMIKDIGTLNRQIARLEADLNDQISEIKKDAEEAAMPLKERREALVEGVKLWAEANRQRLTDGGKVKFADLGTGKISWRFRPPSVRLTKVEAILDALKTLGLHRMIRVKEEPDKEAMLREAEVARTVSGVSIGTEGEDFIIEPFEVDLAASVKAAPLRGGV